jgi:molybdopterin/thiamine biosynthesis adenylyltransferase/rhodanese-related sulfurtransferase
MHREVVVDVGLDQHELTRYSRHILIPGFGVESQLRLKKARVLVIGAGGLGSPVLLYLAAAGVGRLGVVDDDAVDSSNLQRQIIHTEEAQGRLKTESARERIIALNGRTDVVTHEVRLDPTNVTSVLEEYDVIVDATDNFATRYLVSDAAMELRKPLVWGAIFRFEGQMTVFDADSGYTYRALYPQSPPSELAPSCEAGGVLGVMCGLVGSVMATEVVKIITGQGQPLIGTLMTVDALTMQWDRLAIDRRADGEAEEGSDPTLARATDVAYVDALELPDRREPLVLLDVREPFEHQLVSIPGSVLVPLGTLRNEGRSALDVVGVQALDSPVVVYCKRGPRSEAAAEILSDLGFEDVRVLTGGVLEWVAKTDSSLPSY